MFLSTEPDISMGDTADIARVVMKCACASPIVLKHLPSYNTEEVYEVHTYVHNKIKIKREPSVIKFM